MKICLVSTEFPGVGVSGGIGTYVADLARLLAESHEVVVVNAGVEYSVKSDISGYKNVKMLTLADMPIRPHSGGSGYHYMTSLRIYDFLKTKNFDFVNFPDWNALGLATMQAKNSGVAFEGTELSVTIHGPTKWTRQANGRLTSENWEFENTLDFLEMESIRMADKVYSPSEYLANWVRVNTSSPLKNLTVERYPYISRISKIENTTTVISDCPQIVFFGRLEARKGIYNFLEAVLPLIASGACKVTCLGRNILENELRNEFGSSPWFKDVKFVNNLSSNEAFDLLKSLDPLVVIPSLDDNSPFVVREVADLRLRLLTTRVGGIPELVPEGNLCDPDAISLRSRILSYLQNQESIPRSQYLYSFDEDNSNWVDLFSNITSRSEAITSNCYTPRNIGVVVAHYNQSIFLENALKSVQAQSYTNFKCMVIDDGSNSQNLLEFRLIKEQFKYDERFTFIEQSNQDVGYTRNLGARELDTEYLTFLDADDVYTSNYLELLNSAFSRGRDLVVSHFSFINEKFQGLILDEKESFGSYEPYGANVSLLWKRNLLGGANFGISRQLFTTLQGFDEAPKLTHHDWRFLAKAALKGHEVSVIPERTLLYRVIQHSMSRSRNPIESQLLILKEYKNLSEVDLQKLVESLLSSMVVNSHLDMSVNFVSSTERIVRKIQNIGLKLAPYGSKRWSVVLPIYRKLSK